MGRDQSATPELVTHGEGAHCPADDVFGYAAALRRLADAPRQCRTMGDFNRSRVEADFTRDRMIREYRELFEEVRDCGLSP